MSEQSAAGAGGDFSIELADGSTVAVPQGTTGQTLAERISGRLAREAVAMEVNGKVVDLNRELSAGDSVRILTFGDPEGMEVYHHTSTHLMAQAVVELFPDAKPTIGPVVDEGFYYDFDHPPFTDEDLEKIEARMKEIVKRREPVRRRLLSKGEALDVFSDNPYKVELIQDLPDDEEISAYEQGDWIDLCRGPHLPSTGKVKSFKLLKLAGAYWRGDARNTQLQRIYGISFPDKKLLKAHLKRLEEARRRDHRRIGRDMELFSFHDEGPGFAFWHPNGMTVRTELVTYWRECHRRYGYVEVNTPIMLSEDLWHRSGHWENYRENMYFTSIDERKFAVKPMNCPGGILAFLTRRHSYRELPMRVGELGLVHRHELSGVLHGLFRVRAFTQDDAHLYCTDERQARDETVGVIRLVQEMYATFGFTDTRIELSTRPEKRIGTDAMWDAAEAALKDALDSENIDYEVNEGDGAFYGPKIDFHVRDCMGRTWQCGTIQFDMALPERFDLTYEAADGDRKRPIMIHRTVYGSLERFIGILVEHFEGKFPLWIAPEQVRILPLADRHTPYALEACEKLREAGFRATVDERSETLNRKVRDAQLARVNYQCVVGDREAENGTLSIRTRANQQLGVMSLSDFADHCHAEVDERRMPDDFGADAGEE